jgi:hypothetical protein
MIGECDTYRGNLCGLYPSIALEGFIYLFIHSFVHLFAIYIAQVKQNLKHKSYAPSQTIYKTYTNSVNKPINTFDQLKKCEYYLNRLI